MKKTTKKKIERASNIFNLIVSFLFLIWSLLFLFNILPIRNVWGIAIMMLSCLIIINGYLREEKEPPEWWRQFKKLYKIKHVPLIEGVGRLR